MIAIDHLMDVRKHIDGLHAVLFDLDDTLYSEKDYVRSGYREAAKLLPGIPHAAERLWEYFAAGKPAIDALLCDTGCYTEALKQSCLQAYRLQKPDIALYPEADQLLAALRVQGLFIGIITDGRPEGQRAKLSALGLWDRIDAVIITDELGGIAYRKPHPAAFRLMKEKAENGLGKTLCYAQLCYIGDNKGKDFIAPEQLGMRSILYRNRDGIYAETMNDEIHAQR